jgi:uncharacterized membrane protein
VKAVLLSAHVLAAIVLLGPIAVAASAFPRYARAVAAGPDPAGDRAVAGVLHRITRGYAIPALAVPVLGIGVGSALGVLGQAWVLVSMALTAIAGVLLVAIVLPGQRRVLDGLDRAQPGTRAVAALPRLAMVTGLFNAAWALVVVLMILRPGSTTGI